MRKGGFIMKRLHGVVCATITPLDGNGELDEASLRRLCDHLDACGVNGLYPNGTNGEGLLLSPEERQRAAEVVVDRNRQRGGRMSVYVQSTAATTEETCAHVRHAAAVGADGVGVMTPFFFPMDGESLLRFYDDVLAAAPEGFPAYLYNIPGCSGNDISPGLLRKVMDRHANVRGIKFSVPDLMRVEDYLLACKAGTEVLIGCDSLFLQCLLTGGTGMVSGPAMVFGRRFVRLYESWREGDVELARELQRRVVETDRRLLGIPAIPAVKALLAMQGVIATDRCRRPFRSLDRIERNVLKEILEDYGRED